MVVSEERLRAEGARESVVIPSAPAVAPVADVSWSGIWAGTLITLGGAILLTALGVAIGFSVLDARPGAAASDTGWGIAAGIWTFLSLVIPLFLGSMVAARFGIPERGSAMVTGTVVWVLVLLGTVAIGSIRIAVAGVAPAVPAWIAGWSTFGALLLSLLAALAGASAGVPRFIRRRPVV